jgi:hypothetical protein
LAEFVPYSVGALANISPLFAAVSASSGANSTRKSFELSYQVSVSNADIITHDAANQAEKGKLPLEVSLFLFSLSALYLSR